MFIKNTYIFLTNAWIWLSGFLKQNIESISWLPLAAYGKVHKKRDEVEKELANL